MTLQVGLLRAEGPNDRHSVDSRHAQIRKNDVERFRTRHAHGRVPVGNLRDIVAGALERLRQGICELPPRHPPLAPDRRPYASSS